MTDFAQVALERVQSFRAATRFLFPDMGFVRSRRCGRILVVMVDDVSARLTQIV
jgi:hypothetical protein